MGGAGMTGGGMETLFRVSFFPCVCGAHFSSYSAGRLKENGAGKAQGGFF